MLVLHYTDVALKLPLETEMNISPLLESAEYIIIYISSERICNYTPQKEESMPVQRL